LSTAASFSLASLRSALLSARPTSTAALNDANRLMVSRIASAIVNFAIFSFVVSLIYHSSGSVLLISSSFFTPSARLISVSISSFSQSISLIIVSAASGSIVIFMVLFCSYSHLKLLFSVV